MRDIFSSEYWLLGNLALMKLNGARLLFLLTQNLASQSSVHGHQMAPVKNSSLSILSWQDMQFGLYCKALFRGALGKSYRGKNKKGTTQRYRIGSRGHPSALCGPTAQKLLDVT